MKTIFQRGQSLVEFAFVLPFFLFLCGVLMALTVHFADIVYLNNEARIITREYAVASSQTEWDNISKKYQNGKVFFDIYNAWTLTVTPNKYDETAESITVQLRAPLNTSSGWLSLLRYVADDNSLAISATCTMYNEHYNASDTDSSGT